MARLELPTAEQLTTIRRTTDWRRLFEALQIEKDAKKSRDEDWWGKSPFKPDERTASFHINDRGWYCHSTGQGGGVVELVQRVQGITCYEAGRWLTDHGICQIVTEVRVGVGASTAEQDNGTKTVEGNPPIRQDLRQQLKAEHPVFTERGITPQVLYDLGAGYLDRAPRKNGRHDVMNHRLVFQIRGLRQESAERGVQPVILGHIGRATTPIQEALDGKWWTYGGFKKSLELYNIDLAVLEDEAIHQACHTEHLIIVEGCFDIAKLRAAGIHNAVATLGAHLSKQQVSQLDLVSDLVGVERFFLWYDRDQDGSTPRRQGTAQAAELLARRGYYVEVFDWNHHFSSVRRSEIPIPAEITDPAEFSVEQLQWLRSEGWI